MEVKSLALNPGDESYIDAMFYRAVHDVSGAIRTVACQAEHL